jgi:hypothetical protein
MNPAFLGSSKKKAASGGGGGSTYTLLAHTQANNGSSATTAGIDTTGAKLIVISLGWFSGSTTLSDSKGNTWTALTSHNNTQGDYFSRLFYCVNPTVGTGHTFTGAASFVVIIVAAFSYTGTTPAFDVQNGVNPAASNVTTMQPGSVTPAGNNELFITSACWNSTTGTPTASIDSSFAITDQAQQGTNALFSGLAYKIQTASGSENPTYTLAATIDVWAAVIACFK